jgi:hypothetical protein
VLSLTLSLGSAIELGRPLAWLGDAPRSVVLRATPRMTVVEHAPEVDAVRHLDRDRRIALAARIDRAVAVIDSA